MIVFSIFWTFVSTLIAAEAGMMGDQCDWNGSGLSKHVDTKRGVTPVYLRCREGVVSWVYPRGALRIIFRPPLPAGEKDFNVCIRVIRRDDPPDIFHTFEDNYEEKLERYPARLFVEGPEKLVPLYAPDDGDPRELRCFRSKKGRAALYVEAEPEEGMDRRVAALRYEARPVVKKHYDPVTADCRPCTDAELELAFCTSDLVSRGLFVESQHRHDLDTTQLTLKLTKLLRSTTGNYHPLQSDDLNKEDEYFRYDIDNQLEQTTYRNHRRRKERSLHAHVHVSSICGASAGAGEFLVMATKRLGKYSLVCAPRLDDWVDLVRRRNADGSAQCSLHH